jgi:hypothetical protein
VSASKFGPPRPHHQVDGARHLAPKLLRAAIKDGRVNPVIIGTMAAALDQLADLPPAEQALIDALVARYKAIRPCVARRGLWINPPSRDPSTTKSSSVPAP